MTRQITLAALSLATLLATSHAASAQVVAYRHRSTVLGDHLAGASELVRARGSFLVDEANAAETWVRVAAAQDELHYQRAEYRYQEKMMFLEYQKQKVAMRRERQAAAEQDEQVASLRLWQSAQRGAVAWPAALTRSEYMASMSLIASILRTWEPENPSADVYRQALLTETSVLRARVAENQKIDHVARIEAVKALDRVQRLVEMPGLESSVPNGGRLAMR